MGRDGRHAMQPYRVRAGAIWYWVDPTVPGDQIEPGDAVVVYPAGGDAVVAIMQHHGRSALAFSTIQGENFEIARRDIAALHLAAVDDEQ
jgi:hypothetical protein